MHRSLSLRAVVCLSTLLPASVLYAAPDADIETLKKELLELKQRYDVQQKALAVLEQRVRPGAWLNHRPTSRTALTLSRPAVQAPPPRPVALAGVAAPTARPSRTTRPLRKV